MSGEIENIGSKWWKFDTHRLFFDQVEQDILEDATIAKSARSNSMANFVYAFEDVFMAKVIDRMGSK